MTRIISFRTFVVDGPTLRGYVDNIPMFVVTDASHPAGRVALYCWANADARFSEVRVLPISKVHGNWVLEEQFSVLDASMWQVIEDANGSADWAVDGDGIDQSSNIFGGSVDGAEPSKPGTYLLHGGDDLTDLRMAVRLESADNDAIGVMFRYVDDNNYYRLSMDRERSYRRLVRKFGGAFTVLWEDTQQYVTNREYVMTIDCFGDSMRGYLDGVPLFDVQDAAHPAGQVALYCWANTGARFREICVAEPTWQNYYFFGDEEPLAAGSSIRLFAGDEATAAPPVPNLEPRFVAAHGAPGLVTFSPEEPVDLRVVDARSRPGHTRRFLPDSAYSAIAAPTVLRKADGTEFVLRANGEDLPQGQYRLTLTYRRNNQAADPDSIILRQARDSSDEIAVLDIPWL